MNSWICSVPLYKIRIYWHQRCSLNIAPASDGCGGRLQGIQGSGYRVTGSSYSGLIGYRKVSPSQDPGGGDLVLTIPGVCPKVKDMGPFSLKMGIKFAASLNMGENLC